MSHILKYKTWNALNEQKAEGFSCNTAWYKGEELTTDAFGKVLSCSRKSYPSAFEFWTNTTDENKQFILNTLKEGSDGLVKYGLASEAAGMKQASKMPKSYRLSGAAWSKVTRGEKKGTGGFYLDKNNNIYIENSVGTISNGANNIVEVISKLNDMNRENYINGKPQIRIGSAATEATLKTKEGTYKGLQYKLEPMTTFNGLIYYPTLSDPVEKVVRKEKFVEITKVPPFVGSQQPFFKDNHIEPTNTLLNELRTYFKDIQAKKGKITKMTIESGASNARTTYLGGGKIGTEADRSYARNTLLAKDRGTELVRRLREEFGDLIPADVKFSSSVQPCGTPGNAEPNGPCPVKPDESAKKLVINVEGNFPEPREREYTTNQIAYEFTQWRLRQS